MKKVLASCIAALGFMSALVSCKSSVYESVASLIGEDGEPIGLIVSYVSPIATSLTPEAYVVEGEEIAKVFSSSANPFVKKDDPKAHDDGPKGKGGRYVIVLLKEKAPGSQQNGKVLSIKQVTDITTKDGKTVKAWKKAIKADMAYQMNGMRRRQQP